MTRPASLQARNLLADEIGARGPAWRPAADSVRAGYENIWITPALAAIDKALNMDRDDGEHT